MLNRLGLGFGVLCGLGVEPASNGTSVIIEPGVAIDGLGREIVVPAPLCIDPTRRVHATRTTSADRTATRRTGR